MTKWKLKLPRLPELELAPARSAGAQRGRAARRDDSAVRVGRLAGVGPVGTPARRCRWSLFAAAGIRRGRRRLAAPRAACAADTRLGDCAEWVVAAAAIVVVVVAWVATSWLPG